MNRDSAEVIDIVCLGYGGVVVDNPCGVGRGEAVNLTGEFVVELL